MEEPAVQVMGGGRLSITSPAERVQTSQDRRTHTHTCLCAEQRDSKWTPVNTSVKLNAIVIYIYTIQLERASIEQLIYIYIYIYNVYTMQLEREQA